MTGILLRRAEVDGKAPVDVRIADGVITEVGHTLTLGAGEEVIDAGGGAVLPGLCDHHLHLHAIAAASASAQCGPPQVTTPAALAASLAVAQADEFGWVRGVGYSEEVAGLLDATRLDRLHAGRPVRIQHRSGSLWIVNTAGAQALDLADGDHPGIERDHQSRPTGRLWRADNWLRGRLPRRHPPDLRPVATRLASLGITHVTDATPDLNDTTITAISTAMETGALPQHVQLLGAPIGWAPPAGPRSPTGGPYKIILADSGLPDLQSLTQRITAVHASGRAVAAHCVSREALVLVLAALADAGTLTDDRIEHAALIPAELIPRLRDMHVTIVTQPGFLSHRGDYYLREVPASEHAELYRARSLTQAGIACVASSDAPYGPLDPWAVITAAALRTTPAGQVIGLAERLTPRLALAGYLSSPGHPAGTARRVAVGHDADLVVLHTPLEQALATPSADNVAATVIDGTIAWRAHEIREAAPSCPSGSGLPA
jgi:predicted amidohydrolase YtcJ